MTFNAIRSKSFWLGLLFYGTLILLVSPILLRQIHANDLWKALYSGRYLSLFHHFPHHSTFTYSPVKDFLGRDAYNWFGNLTFVGIYQLGGLHGLQVFRILIAGFAIVLFHAETRFSRTPFILLVLILATYGISQKLRLRTAIFAVPFTLTMLWCWLRYDFDGDPRFLYGLPVLFLLWGNMHGSYIIGIALFLVLLFGKGVELLLQQYRTSDSNPWAFGRLILVTLLITGSVTYAKPYVDDKFSESLGSIPGRLFEHFDLNEVPETESNNTQTRMNGFDRIKRILRESIAPARGFRSNEFGFPLTNMQYAFVRAGFLLGGILLIALIAGRLPYSYLPLLVATLIFGMAYLRSVPYLTFVLGSLGCFCYGRNRLPDWLDSSLINGLALFVIVTLGVAIITVSSTGLSNLTHQKYHRFGFGKVQKFSNAIPRYVLKNYPRRRIANSLNTGTFLIWKFWPYKRVFVDSKTSAYPIRFWQSIRKHGVRKILKFNGIGLFIVSRTNPNAQRLSLHPEWVLERSRNGLLLFKYRPMPNH